MKKQKSAKKPVTHRACKLALACVMAFFVLSIITTQVKIAAVKSELSKINDQIAKAQDENTKTQQILDSEDDSAFIERMAREKLGLVMPGEQVFSDISGS